MDKTGTSQCSIPCNLCGSKLVEEVRNKDRHGAYLRSVACRRCGLVWTDPRPGPEQVREFYSHEYRLDYKGTYQPQPKHIYRSSKVALYRYQALRELLQPGFRTLDVGAGSGEVVYMLRALGYDATGIEPNEGYARYAVETLGLPVKQGFFQEAAIPPGSTDLVTIFHALEHLEDPFRMLQQARLWLRDEGYLLVEVPNVEAVCQQPHTQFHIGHIYHFSLATLGMLGRRAGYSVVRGFTSPDGGNITVIFQKTTEVPAASGEIPGNYERVAGILNRHTALRHAFSRYPYIRPLRKLGGRIEEYLKVRSGRAPKEVLDSFVRSI